MAASKRTIAALKVLEERLSHEHMKTQASKEIGQAADLARHWLDSWVRPVLAAAIEDAEGKAGWSTQQYLREVAS